MRVFVTGATGFLGGELTRALIARGHEVLALARTTEGMARHAALAPGATFIQGDLFSPQDWRSGLARFRPDALIHCGWRGVVGAERNDLAQLENIAASARLAEAAIECGAQVVIGVGSQAEYGARSGAFGETDPTTPETLYGASKLATSGAFLTLGAIHGVRAVWGRVFSLYGPGNDGPWLVPSLIRALSNGQQLDLTRCEQIWEFTHVRDAAQGFVALLETPQAHGVFNVASGAPAPLRDAVLLLRDMIDRNARPNFGAIPYRPDQVMHLEAKIDRIRAVTGWSPRIGLMEGFEETVAAFRRERMAA
ncbi:NAD(P)-dependent oxidoreductase [Methylocystis sp. WRRC1]|uniref:NAD-dependent epimerase/dehydratase family protein n=1 Tax=Methylocystis sp. WRRC1 TaxID=1732014 RepID=UPI001D13DFFC|nr:NAD(P)-dependent oxidoreductase [Methylocystis sp. WRRC1]MCC3245815.1 NAD(P)-dependent oxidoreductase [Methylocystis sp. WRRC1]